MCEQCWDADKKAELLEKQEVCDGDIEPFMTMHELKSSLFQEWSETGKNQYRIFRKALLDPPISTYTWIAVKAGKNGLPEKQESITVKFV